jgi:hypothetical protein
MSKKQCREAEPAEKQKPSASKRDPDPREQAAMDKAVAYCRGRTAPPAYEVKKVQGGAITVEIPHSNPGGFIAQQRATFGTVSEEFAARSGGEVGNILRNRGEPMPSAEALNAGVAAVAGIEPQTEQEAMLAVQMVGTHAMAMEMMSLAKQTESVDRMERYGNLATKFLRTYTTQMETLAKLRRGGQQTVRVEHVHVYNGGQAIVGPVTTGGDGQIGGGLENGNQPHALTGAATYALPAGAPVLRQDTGRAGMPIARGEREEAVPDARRRERKRRAKG